MENNLDPALLGISHLCIKIKKAYQNISEVKQMSFVHYFHI
jgi:hypothetical protein